MSVARSRLIVAIAAALYVFRCMMVSASSRGATPAADVLRFWPAMDSGLLAAGVVIYLFLCAVEHIK